MRTDRRTEKIEQVLSRKQPDLTVVLEDIHDPHNVSAILRSCDAVGIKEVHLLYTQESFPDIGTKSSASAKKWIERKKHHSVEECYDYLRERGFSVFATRITGDSFWLYDLDLTKKIALVFGNEHRGVSEQAAEKADGAFQIPMLGMIQSLNVSVACAVSLFEALRQRQIAGHYNSPKLTRDEFHQMKQIWLEK
jgi:tRNA (guanosine-2'-O-)-methyltransferase